MLLNSAKKKVGHVKLTVGSNDPKYDWEVGYHNYYFGSLDRVPYWNDKKLDEPFYLNFLYGNAMSERTEIDLSPKYADPIGCTDVTITTQILETGETCSIDCRVYGKNGVSYGKRGVSTIDESIYLTLSKNIGKTLTLEFIPPPDGYL